MSKKRLPLQQQSGFEDQILELIDSAEELTRSDLQGAVTAIVWKISEASYDQGYQAAIDTVASGE